MNVYSNNKNILTVIIIQGDQWECVESK